MNTRSVKESGKQKDENISRNLKASSKERIEQSLIKKTLQNYSLIRKKKDLDALAALWEMDCAFGAFIHNNFTIWKEVLLWGNGILGYKSVHR